jgi:hypothetical protein
MEIHIHIDDRLIRPLGWLLRRRAVAAAAVVALIVGAAAAVLAITQPPAFSDGDTLTADALNKRFDPLYAAANDMEAFQQLVLIQEGSFTRTALLGAAAAYCAGFLPDETTDVAQVEIGKTGQDACSDRGGGAVSGWGCDAMVFVSIAASESPGNSEIRTDYDCLDVIDAASMPEGTGFFGCCHRGDPVGK